MGFCKVFLFCMNAQKMGCVFVQFAQSGKFGGNVENCGEKCGEVVKSRKAEATTTAGRQNGKDFFFIIIIKYLYKIRKKYPRST